MALSPDPLHAQHIARRFDPVGGLISTKRWLGAICGVAVGSVAIAASATVPDPMAVIALLRDQDTAVLRAGERLVVAGRPYCTGPGFSAGMTVQRLGQYGAAYRAAATAVLGLADFPTVTVVAPGSAAESAGLRMGDRIIAADGQALPVVPARTASGEHDATATALDLLDAALADGTMRLEIERAGKRLAIDLAGRPACHARFDVRAGRANNAYSDGITIQVSSDLVAYARGEGELAAILAHELAHNILRHPQRRKARGPRPSVRQTEIEADRLSAYLLEAAGYGIGGAVSFWSRWGRANDLGILSDRSHPGWQKRIASIEAEAALIAAARAAGRPVELPSDLRL